MIRAVLTKPLDGQPEGTERDFDQPDFDRLKAMGAVKEADATLPAPAPDVASPTIATDPGADEKAAPPPLNKAAPRVSNKAV